MKTVPHRHHGRGPGDVEVCWDQFCARVTLEEEEAAVLGGALVGGVLGALASRHWAGAIVGAVVGGIIGGALAPRETGRPSY